MLNLQRLYNLLKERVEFVDGYPPLDELTEDIIRANQAHYEKLYDDIKEELLSWSNAAQREVIHDHWWRGKIITDECDLKALISALEHPLSDKITDIIEKYGLEDDKK